MKVGIIVYSQTGHTLSVANKLEHRVATAGHAVNLKQLKTAGPVKPGAGQVQLVSLPAVDVYDALVFGAPVWGGLVASPMASYLEGLPSLEGKNVACLVTHFFRPAWGANQALGQMKEVCESKGARVRGSGDVTWFRLGRKRQIVEVVDDLMVTLGL
jgi:flavodoxin